MERVSDVNPAFAAWKLSTGREKEWALTVLIERLERFATAICWRRLPDHKSDFEPLVNDIVWRAINHADGFEGEANFSTWYYRIIINECNRFLRKYKTRLEVSLEDAIPIQEPKLDARIDLIALLDRLEPQDHLLLRLIAEGQDFAIIGKIMGISRNTAIVRWHRLRRRLRDASL